MNYRHLYHAGNFCDVAKHAALCLILRHLQQKPSSFALLDTHAGNGLYDLNSAEALKTGEAHAGILKLTGQAAQHESFIPYVESLIKAQARWSGGMPPKQQSKVSFASFPALAFYPGSPLFLLLAMRGQDRLVLCEKHPEEASRLKRILGREAKVQIHCRDGYEALKAFLPPAEQRGLVLIDPPYEAADEFSRAGEALVHAYERWPHGIFMLWYPVKDRAAFWGLQEKLLAAQIPKLLRAELWRSPDTLPDRLNGSGLFIINPPWQLDVALRALYAELREKMALTDGAVDISWLGTAAP